MQACLDRAAESLIPPEVDEEKLKQIAKQCALAWSCESRCLMKGFRQVLNVLSVGCRKKVANENRLQDKKKASFKKSERRAKIDY